MIKSNFLRNVGPFAKVFLSSVCLVFAISNAYSYSRTEQYRALQEKKAGVLRGNDQKLPKKIVYLPPSNGIIPTNAFGLPSSNDQKLPKKTIYLPSNNNRDLLMTASDRSSGNVQDIKTKKMDYVPSSNDQKLSKKTIYLPSNNNRNLLMTASDRSSGNDQKLPKKIVYLPSSNDTRSVSMSDVSSHINKQNILIEREMEILKKQLQSSSLRKINMDFDAKLKKFKEDLKARIDKFEAEWVKYRDEVSRINSQRELQLDREIQKFKLRLTQLNNKNLSKIIERLEGVDRGKNGEQDDYSEIADLFEENDEWGLQDSSTANDVSSDGGQDSSTANDVLSDGDLGACIHPENALSEEEAFQNIIRIVSVAQKSSSKLTAILCRNALETINSEYEDFKEATAKLDKERKILSISKALGSYNIVISKLDPVYGFKSLTYEDLVNHLAYNNRNTPKS